MYEEGNRFSPKSKNPSAAALNERRVRQPPALILLVALHFRRRRIPIGAWALRRVLRYTGRFAAIDGSRCLELTGHTKIVTCLAVLPDGGLASGSTDKTVRLWL